MTPGAPPPAACGCGHAERAPTGRKVALVAALALAVGAVGAVLETLRGVPAALDAAQPGAAAAGPSGEQVATLEAAGGVYAPNVIHVRAGVPLRLRVSVRERHACATRLLVPDLGVDLALVSGGVSEVVIAAPPPGAHVFTCAEKMVKGTIVVE